MISSATVQQYCIRNNLFTLGSNEQYDRMLDLVRDGFPLHDLATIIWICSKTDKHADEIEKELQALMIPDVAERSEEYADQSGLSPAT